MALIDCPECHARVSDQAVACPHCGHPIAASAPPQAPSVRHEIRRPVRPRNKQDKNQSEGTWRWIVGGIVAAFLLAGLCSTAANNNQASSAVPSAAPQSAPKATPLPGIGQRASAGQWAAELTSVQPMDKIGTEVSQGRFVVITVGMTNLHNQASALNSWDFALKSPDGATFSPSGNGNTALAFTPGAPVPVLPVQVQPGLTQALRLAFDVNPAIGRYTLEAARIIFDIQLT